MTLGELVRSIEWSRDIPGTAGDPGRIGAGHATAWNRHGAGAGIGVLVKGLP
jgi:hypothetical protein